MRDFPDFDAASVIGTAATESVTDGVAVTDAAAEGEARKAIRALAACGAFEPATTPAEKSVTC